MRILSISDIHGELETFDILVEKLVKLTFDVVLIAGDMGGREESKTIIRELSIFGKPIFYVMGNWDCFPYDEVLHKEAVHIHLNHQQVGEWIFLGYSGCAVNGYKSLHAGNNVIEVFGLFRYCKTAAFDCQPAREPSRSVKGSMCWGWSEKRSSRVKSSSAAAPT